MTTLYLIAHKVRGEPAFDIAEQVTCAVCEGTEIKTIGDGIGESCDCIGGKWWIVSTSGHRAYPYWSEQLDRAVDFEMCRVDGNELLPMPTPWPDHYSLNDSPTKAEAKAQGQSLLQSLGLLKAQVPITRRKL